MNNNPVRYNDPSGHCVDPLTCAALGAALGFVVNYSIQAVKNYQEGKSFTEAISFSNMDKKALAVATVGGAVAGLTMGVASALVGTYFVQGSVAAFVGEYVVGGAVANVLAGQVEALESAKYDEHGEYIPFGQQSHDEYWDKAKADGFLNLNTVVEDAVIGSFTATLGGAFKSAMGASVGPKLEPNTVFWVRAGNVAYDYADDYMKRNYKVKKGFQPE